MTSKRKTKKADRDFPINSKKSFGGKTYRLWGRHSTKLSAKHHAEKLRKQGMSARRTQKSYTTTAFDRRVARNLGHVKRRKRETEYLVWARNK